MVVRGIAALTALGALALPGAASAQDPPFIDWNPFLPGLSSEYMPNQAGDCVNGDPACVDATLAEMYRRFDRLYATCDHNAVFSITYIRVTEQYRKADRAGGFFDDPVWLAQQDKTFARMYYEAYDAWAAGDLQRVPVAWRLALDAARDHKVSALGNLLMSMNAHVNRDQPYMMAAVGLNKPDGTSHKADHDKFNMLLNQVYDDVLAEVSQKFDPSTDDFTVPGTVWDDAAVFQLLQGWREMVWRHAEMLSAAKTTAERARVAAEIEAYAEAQGRLIMAASAYPSPLFGQSTAARDAWCRAHYFPRPGATHTAAKQGRATLTGRRVRVKRRVGLAELRCPAGGGECPGTLIVQRRRRILGRGDFSLPAGTRRVVRLAMRRGARLRGRATLVLRTPDATSKRRGTLG